MRKVLITLIIVFLIPVISFSAGKKNEGTPVEFEVIEASHQGGLAENSNLIAKKEADFAYIWDLTHRTIEPKPSMPSVDFGKFMVAAVMMGERNSSGYSVDISNITAYDDSVVVSVFYNEEGGMLT
ncbi:MAG: protease complex subunit PrcB family protein, partial [candidate division Zixibacteria bacterium]|nr:protease complex subunit PrcB family protein [candidate division Zixibacteria bacterium]